MIKEDFMLDYFRVIIMYSILISILVKPTVKLGEEFKVLITQPRIDPWSTKNGNSQTNLDYFEIFKELTFDKLKSDQYDFIIAPETYFSEGYGENLEYFEYTKLYDSLNNFLNKFKNTNLISGIQFFQLYQNEENKPSKTANFVRDNLWVDYYNSSINFSADKGFEYNHKAKLVVGSEYMPLKSFLEPLLEM